MDQLQKGGFEELTGVATPCGVYCLVWKGEAVYVGQSKNLYSRIGEHLRKRGKERRKATERIWLTPGDHRREMRFDEVWVKWCAVHELERLELTFIKQLKPRWNIQVREPLPEVKINIRQLAERMGWKLGEAKARDLIRGRSL